MIRLSFHQAQDPYLHPPFLSCKEIWVIYESNDKFIFIKPLFNDPIMSQLPTRTNKSGGLLHNMA